MTLFQEINAIRKEGRIEEAYQKAKTSLEANPNDEWIKKALSWVYYELVSKSINTSDFDGLLNYLSEIKSLELPAEEVMFFDKLCWKLGSALNKLNAKNDHDLRYLLPIKDFCLCSKLESYEGGYNFLIKMLHKAFKETAYYTELIYWWNLDYLSKEDFNQGKTSDGKPMLSIGEQIYISVCKVTLPHTKPDGEIQFDKNFASKLEKRLADLIIKYPDSKYLEYYRAKLLYASGDKESSLKCFIPVAQRKRNDFWIWALLGDLLSDRPDDQIACLCRALQCSSPPEMFLKVRENLAELLIERKLYAEARVEIDTIINIRLRNNFRISQKIQDWTHSEWYLNAHKLENNKAFYATHSPRAEDLIYSEKPSDFALIDGLNETKQIAYFIKSDKKRGFFKYDRFLNKPQKGDLVNIRIKETKEDGYTILYSARFVDNQLSCAELKRPFNGSIKMKEGQNFGFVEDVFVSPSIVAKNQIRNGQLLKGVCVLSFDRKKEKWGWEVLEVSIEY